MTHDHHFSRINAAWPLVDMPLFIIALLALACAPTQWTFSVRGILIHPAEPLLMVAGILWAIRWVRVRDSADFPPMTHWLVIIAVVLGIFATGEHFQFAVLKEAAKMLLYLIVAYIVFHAAFSSPHRWRLALLALLITTSVAVLIGVGQWVQIHVHQQRIRHAAPPMIEEKYASWTTEAQGTPRWVHSAFGHWIPAKGRYDPSRTAYCAFLALVTPLLLGLLVVQWRHWGLRLWLVAMLLGIAVTAVAGYVVPALVLGAFVTLFAVRPRRPWWAICGVLAYFGVVALLGQTQIQEVLIRPYQLQIPAAASDDGLAHLKRFWGEQQVALNLIRYSPLLGVGAGGYQARVDQSWGFLGSIGAQFPEVDAYNGYLLFAAETGMIGLLALFMLYGSYARRAWTQWRIAPGDPWRAAALGGMSVLLIVTGVTVPFSRAIFLLLVALFVLINRTGQWEAVGDGILKKEDYLKCREHLANE